MAKQADVFSVHQVMSLCSTFDAIFITGEDIDLLILPMALISSQCNIYFRDREKSKL